MKRYWLSGVLSASVLAAGLVAVASAPAGAGVKPLATHTWYVAPPVGRSKLPGGCKTAKFSRLNPAISTAAAGDTVVVCAGTYTGSASVKVPYGKATITVTSGALIEKRINLVGETGAIINASGLINGVTLFGPGAAGTTVNGITSENAIGEGILAAVTGKVTIENSTVMHNDKGGKWLECTASGNVPGDCGEGIHLLTVTGATVLNNTVEFNSGGILLSDEFGPTSHNMLRGNLVEDNESDCGITVVGHNTGGVKNGVPQPKIAGVYDNLITANMVISNGTTGDGGGVLLAGVASYDNTVTKNEIDGNGLSGVTIHEHSPGLALSGDVIEGNWIGTNNVDGDFGDPLTTGVFIERDSRKFPPIKVTVTSNTISFDHYGIFDSATPGLTVSGNVFINVKVDLKT